MFANMFGDNASVLMALLVFLAAGTLAFSVMAVVRVHGAVKRRAARIAGRRRARGKSDALAAPFQPEGGAAAHRIHHQALCRDQRRQHEGAAPAADPGRHLRSARGRLFLPRAHRAGGRARASPCSCSLPMLTSHGGSIFWLMVIVGGIVGYVGPSIYIDRRIAAPQGRAPRRLSGFHGPAGGVRRFRAVSMEASLDRVGRELGDSYPSLTANIHMTNLEIRAGRTMSDALEHLRRPARPRGGALVRHPDPAVDRTRLQHHRCAAGLFATTCATSGCRAPRRRPKPAGQAVAADDDLHLPGAVRGHPAAGVRAAACRELLLICSRRTAAG